MKLVEFSSRKQLFQHYFDIYGELAKNKKNLSPVQYENMLNDLLYEYAKVSTLFDIDVDIEYQQKLFRKQFQKNMLTPHKVRHRLFFKKWNDFARYIFSDEGCDFDRVMNENYLDLKQKRKLFEDMFPAEKDEVEKSKSKTVAETVSKNAIVPCDKESETIEITEAEVTVINNEEIF